MPKKTLVLAEGAQQVEGAVEREPEVEEAPPEAGVLWYYLDEEDRQYGPMSFAALTKAWEEEKVGKSTYLWNEDMENWETVEKLPSIFEEFTSE